MQVSNKHWLIIFGVLGLVIVTLLAIIAWKKFPPSVVGKQEIQTDVAPAVSMDIPVNLILVYYQAIAAGKSDRVHMAWADPGSRQARYAVQAMQDFPDALCRPLKVAKVSPESTTDASVSVDLACGKAASVQTHSVMFELGKQAEQWKIMQLHMPAALQNR